MYLVDTSALSQPLKPVPDAGVMRLLNETSPLALFLSVITIQEIRFGIDLLPEGKRRRELDNWLLGDVVRRFEGRVLPVTEKIADECGRMLAIAHAEGAEPELADALIAATARVHGLRIMTLNKKHFKRLHVSLADL